MATEAAVHKAADATTESQLVSLASASALFSFAAACAGLPSSAISLFVPRILGNLCALPSGLGLNKGSAALGKPSLLTNLSLANNSSFRCHPGTRRPECRPRPLVPKP